jgi:hypothetical protein
MSDVSKKHAAFIFTRRRKKNTKTKKRSNV